MSQPSPVEQKSQETPAAAAPVAAPGFEVQVQAFWEKNRQQLLLACVAVVLVIVAREGWQYYTASREETIKADFVRAAGKAEKLAAFAEANPGHALAGLAHLQLADQKFEAAEYQQAAASYLKAAGLLKNEAVLGRTLLGAAVSQVSAGEVAAGEAALKALSADAARLKSVRAEAAYHLAAIASEAGRFDDVRKLADEVMKVDPAGPWSQRATMLLAGLPSGTQPLPAASGPVSFTPTGK